MKVRLILILSSFVLPIGVGVAFAEPAKAGKLSVHFGKLDKKDGHVLLQVAGSRAIYDSKDQFSYSAKLPVDGDSVTATFEGVPHGEYAVKVFHDTNDNQKIDIGWRGPTEKYGFSNNVMGFMGPPDFDDAKFVFDKAEMIVEIEAK